MRNLMRTPEERREAAEQLGYTYRCRGCGRLTDTGWCGCAAGEPDDEPEEDGEAWDVEKRDFSG